jgi:hypothetical protein
MTNKQRADLIVEGLHRKIYGGTPEQRSWLTGVFYDLRKEIEEALDEAEERGLDQL